MSPALPPFLTSLFGKPRRSDSHKGDFGRAVLIGGSRGMAGSIAMSSVAALKTGSGLVTAMVPDRCLESVAAVHPAIMTLPLSDSGLGRFATDAVDQMTATLASASAIGIGPGMTTDAGSVGVVRRVLSEPNTPKVIDADAINILAKERLVDDSEFDGSTLVLTPHPGECHRLLGVPASRREQQIDAATSFCQRTGAIIVLKGGPSVVIDGQQVTTNNTGNPGMATAGSGDVLTGIITSLLGQGHPRLEAAQLGVWLHGLAGDTAAKQQGMASMTAMEMIHALPQAIQAVPTPSSADVR